MPPRVMLPPPVAPPNPEPPRPGMPGIGLPAAGPIRPEPPRPGRGLPVAGPIRPEPPRPGFPPRTDQPVYPQLQQAVLSHTAGITNQIRRVAPYLNDAALHQLLAMPATIGNHVAVYNHLDRLARNAGFTDGMSFLEHLLLQARHR